jgi:hypothetical protein
VLDLTLGAPCARYCGSRRSGLRAAVFLAHKSNANQAALPRLPGDKPSGRKPSVKSTVSLMFQYFYLALAWKDF